MTTIDHNNTKLVDVLGCNGETFFCWVDDESGEILREFDVCDLDNTPEYAEFWDAGREAVVGAWVDSTGKIAEIVDETTREAESELALEDDFLFAF